MLELTYADLERWTTRVRALPDDSPLFEQYQLFVQRWLARNLEVDDLTLFCLLELDECLRVERFRVFHKLNAGGKPLTKAELAAKLAGLP